MFHPDALKILPDLLESMNDSIIIDRNGIIIFFSESYAKDSKIASKDVIGKHVQDVIKNTRLHLVLETGEEESGQVFYSIIQDRENHEEMPVHFCNRIPIRKNGEVDEEVIGAFAYTVLSNPFDVTNMREQLDNMKKHDVMISNHLREIYQPKFMLDSIVGSSESIENVRRLVKKVALSNLTVTITGETGTGKELVACAIHEMSSRKDGPFVKINCAAIPDNLIESELFGYEAGSFTGALKNGKIGKFELANHGTILLDEIGEMPLPLQAKLLRVLQESEVERIGGKKSIPLDVRFLCSTNRDLSKMCDEGTFRSDLYYRLNVVSINVPSLMERSSDIPELCECFIKKYRNKNVANITGIDPSVYDFLATYKWPGNVRELEHAIECACVMANEGTLMPHHFDFLKSRMTRDNVITKTPAIACSPLRLSESPNITADANSPSSVALNFQELEARTAAEERSIILRSLEKNHYNIAAVSADLKTNRSSLYRKLKKYGLYPYE